MKLFILLMMLQSIFLCCTASSTMLDFALRTTTSEDHDLHIHVTPQTVISQQGKIPPIQLQQPQQKLPILDSSHNFQIIHNTSYYQETIRNIKTDANPLYQDNMIDKLSYLSITSSQAITSMHLHPKRFWSLIAQKLLVEWIEFTHLFDLEYIIENIKKTIQNDSSLYFEFGYQTWQAMLIENPLYVSNRRYYAAFDLRITQKNSQSTPITFQLMQSIQENIPHFISPSLTCAIVANTDDQAYIAIPSKNLWPLYQGFELENKIQQVSFSKDNHFIALQFDNAIALFLKYNQNVKLWQTLSGYLDYLENQNMRIDFNHNNTLLITTKNSVIDNQTSFQFMLLHENKDQITFQVYAQYQINYLTQPIFSHQDDYMLIQLNPQTIQLKNLHSNVTQLNPKLTLPSQYHKHQNYISTFNIDPKDDYIAIGTTQGLVFLYHQVNHKQWEYYQPTKITNHPISAMIFTGNQDLILASNIEKKLSFWKKNKHNQFSFVSSISYTKNITDLKLNTKKNILFAVISPTESLSYSLLTPDVNFNYHET
ncbi:MAG: hypothetical protein HAW62_01860 [Endozoicomonadaceae bacterium]|nr:hypothetical protein [Endozoicomonadaceae bacterium]